MKYYISITGLDLKAFYHAPKFWMYAIPAMGQARSSEGNISADGNTIQGTHHTLSVWEDRKSMLNYMRKGSHVKAMKILDDVATGKYTDMNRILFQHGKKPENCMTITPVSSEKQEGMPKRKNGNKKPSKI